MIDIGVLINQQNKVQNTGVISLCGKLEAYIGNYFLSGCGIPDNEVETLYYDASIDRDDCVELVEKNIVAYYIADESIGFVKKQIAEKLKKETEEYGITYIAVDDFYQELLCIDVENVPECLKNIIWIDDDFMSDENIPFDFEAFELIDSRVNYLNPKHFSVSQLINALYYE